MKRFIPVLALALILILASWDDASSRRYPISRIDEPIYDHPWGGDQNNPEVPVGRSISNPGKGEVTIIQIIKSWNIRLFFYGGTFIGAGSSERTTTPTATAVTEPSTGNSSSAVQGGNN